MVKINRKNEPATKLNDDSLDAVIERYRQKERTLFPLRINTQTIIFVAKKKCTKEYAQWYRENRMR